MPKQIKNSQIDMANVKPKLFSVAGVFGLVLLLLWVFFSSQLLSIYWVTQWLFAPTLDLSGVLVMGSSRGQVLSYAMLVNLLLLTAVIVAIILIKKGSVRRYLAWYPFSAKSALLFIGIWLVLVLCSEGLSYTLDKNPLEFFEGLFVTAEPVWLLILAVAVVAPIYEELVFRGLMWSALAEQMSGKKGVIFASVVSSLLFALSHLQYDVYEMSLVFCLGLLFSFARAYSGSLWLAIVLHILNNSVAVGQFLWLV